MAETAARRPDPDAPEAPSSSSSSDPTDAATPGYPKGFRKALKLATRAHGKAVRPGTAIPAVTRAVITAETLAHYHPDRPELILAGLLHDAVDAGELPVKTIRKKLGKRVAALSAAAALPPAEGGENATEAAAWRARRADLLYAIDDDDAVRLLVADALTTLRAVRRDLEHPWIGAEGWQRQEVGRDDTLWYCRELLSRARALSDEFLVLELGRELGAVESA